MPYTLGISFKSPAGDEIYGKVIELAGDVLRAREPVIAALTNDVLVVLAGDLGAEQLMIIEFDQGVTMEIHSPSAPTASISVAADTPLILCRAICTNFFDGVVFFDATASPFSALYFSNAGATPANGKVYSLIDG